MLLALCLALACSKDFKPRDFGKFEKLLNTSSTTFDEVFEATCRMYNLGEETLGPFADRIALMRAICPDYIVYDISYRTTDPLGRPVTASGSIFYPKSFGKNGVLEICPINKSRKDCVTRDHLSPEPLTGIMGYIMLIPDLIGCGESENLPIAYLQNENTAVVCADFRLAAEEFIGRQYKYQLPQESILYGYSLGAAGTMSLARYYATHPELGISVKEIYAGGGAYYPLTVVQEQLKGRYADFAIIPNILYSFLYYEDIGLTPEEMFKGGLLEHFEQWCDGGTTIDELTERLGKDMGSYMNEDFLTRLRDGQCTKLQDVLASKSFPDDWTPSCKVNLYHAPGDLYVPTACSDSLYSRLSRRGADVTYTNIGSSHVDAGALVELELVRIFLSRLLGTE